MELHIEIGALEALVSSLKKAQPQISSIAIITDSIVEKLYGQKLLERLESAGFAACLFAFPEGEASKTRRTKEEIEDGLIEAGFDKTSGIVALGGGVVLDLAGFIAATYMRGLRLYSCPTTLLAMIDACYGGKNGVNTDVAKNAIGSIHFPEAIFIDPSFLKTLDKAQLLSGAAEVVKHALIQDREMALSLLGFDWSFSSDFNLNSAGSNDTGDTGRLEELISKNLKIKAGVVERSLQDKAGHIRDQLNFGHTLGHALEALCDYQIPHGYAVFVGMVFASFLSTELGVLAKEEYRKIERLIHRVFPGITALMALVKEGIDSEDGFELLLEHLERDKKNKAGKVHFVLIEAIGQVREKVYPIDLAELKSYLDKFFTKAISYENASVR